MTVLGTSDGVTDEIPDPSGTVIGTAALVLLAYRAGQRSRGIRDA